MIGAVDDAGTPTPTLIQSVQRALRLVEAVGGRSARASAKELARETRLPLPTTYHLLRTLVHEGFLVRLDDGTYLLGPAVADVAAAQRDHRSAAAVREVMADLRDIVGAPAYFARYRDGEITVVEIVDAPKVPRIDLWLGMHDAAHATALGKCILASLDGQARRDYLADHDLYALTRRTHTDARELASELERFAGVALDREEYALGVQCVATPVVARGMVGAVGVSQAAGRSRVPRPTLVAAVQRAAQRLSRTLALTA